jgi:hypothetical protein
MRATWPDDSRPGRRFERGWVSDYSGKEKFGASDEHALPDFTDHATVYCLLAIVREEWHEATIQLDGGVWWLAARNGTQIGAGATEVEALVAALEAAP